MIRLYHPISAAIVMAVSPLQAGQCGYENCWGAIGFNSTGNFGAAFSHWSEERAYRSAQDQCGWNCAEMRTFKNACAAIAQGETGHWNWAKGTNRSSAEKTANRLCSNRSHNCEIVVWACSR